MPCITTSRICMQYLHMISSTSVHSRVACGGNQEEESQRIKSEQTKLLRAMDCFSEGVMLISTLTSTWDILFINDAWTRITGGAPCMQIDLFINFQVPVFSLSCGSSNCLPHELLCVSVLG